MRREEGIAHVVFFFEEALALKNMLPLLFKKQKGI